MQGAVPPAGTAFRELSRTVEESESHTSCAASFVDHKRSICRAKIQVNCDFAHRAL
jgi:hypothetical protein